MICLPIDLQSSLCVPLPVFSCSPKDSHRTPHDVWLCMFSAHKSTFNGTSSEEALGQCNNTMQPQVTPQGLLEVTRSDVLWWLVYEEEVVKKISKQYALRKQQFACELGDKEFLELLREKAACCSWKWGWWELWSKSWGLKNQSDRLWNWHKVEVGVNPFWHLTS